MDRCLANSEDNVADHGRDACHRQGESCNPLFAVSDAVLAQLCTARAVALRSLHWATEAERYAVRAGTASLLDAVAHRLAEHPEVPEMAPVAGVGLRLKDLIPESEHGPYLAAYARGKEQSKEQGFFGS